ncbi:MAG: TetR/AcrR family transcriptional regulator [Thermoactinospora sp.]|nr:TetR/AcrR family transcriptional regulator [Thermoactinospora sp.]
MRHSNRGPSAAAENRAALIKAARQVFASDGYNAPLSAITRAARVGQGSLYRHFPDRISLALAAFEDGVAELEALAARPGTTLEEVLDLVTRQTIDSTAFIDMVRAETHDTRIADIRDRVEALLTAPLAQAQEAGRMRADLTPGDLMLAIGMLAGILAKLPAPDRRRTAEQAWHLLRVGLNGERPAG